MESVMTRIALKKNNFEGEDPLEASQKFLGKF